ncbi:MAG TPA: esterase-like activity of phytase family protein [Candidatus Binatia bacterium]
MRRRKSFGRSIILAGFGVAAAFLSEALPAAGPEVKAKYVLSDVHLADFQKKTAGAITNDRKILLGSIGSDLWHGPGDAPGEFWMLTDRGPNGQIKVNGENRRTFPVPEFNPTILKVRTENGAIRIVETIPMLTRSGKPVTGMPNTKGRDETPYNYAAERTFAFNPNGVDTEGLVRSSAGDFWVAEEYGPSLLKIDRTGKVLRRYVPKGVRLDGADYDVVEALPEIFAKRKINRGFEGLAMSRDEKKLYLALQSPLLNPDKKTGDVSRQTRILVFDVANEKTVAEYAYSFDASKEFDPAHSAPDEMKVSAIAAIGADVLLVDERTDWVAKLYRVDLKAATNILGSRWDDAKTSPALEALNDLSGAGFKPLEKALVVDLGGIPGIPEKIEGIAVVDQNTVAICNDNDFDIGDFDAQGNNVGKGIKNSILFIQLPQPLQLTDNEAVRMSGRSDAK